MPKKNVVIAGAGFAGFQLAQALVKTPSFSVTLVDKTDAFEFTPLILETITQNLSTRTVAEPLQEAGHRITVRKDEVKEANLDKKELVLAGGTLPYDLLVLSIGSTTQYFNTPGAAEHTLPIRALKDARAIRQHIEQSVDAARENEAEREALLTVVIVGAGPTGVETACEIHDLIYGQLRQQHPLVQKARVILVDMKPTVLAVLEPWFSKTAAKRLGRMRIELKLGAKVLEIQDKAITLETETIAAHTIIWAAGMKANDIALTPALEKDRMGRITVDNRLRAAGREDVYALGDIACFTDAKTGKPLPQTAQIATTQARYLARALALHEKGKSVPPYAFKQKGYLVSLGRFNAMGTVFGVNVEGLFGWLVWKMAYLSELVTTTQRMRALREWTLNIFGKRYKE